MEWKIHLRRGADRFQHTARDLSSALAVACLFVQRGLLIEKIEGPEDFEVGRDAIRALCGETG